MADRVNEEMNERTNKELKQQEVTEETNHESVFAIDSPAEQANKHTSPRSNEETNLHASLIASDAKQYEHETEHMQSQTRSKTTNGPKFDQSDLLHATKAETDPVTAQLDKEMNGHQMTPIRNNEISSLFGRPSKQAKRYKTDVLANEHPVDPTVDTLSQMFNKKRVLSDPTVATQIQHYQEKNAVKLQLNQFCSMLIGYELFLSLIITYFEVILTTTIFATGINLDTNITAIPLIVIACLAALVFMLVRRKNIYEYVTRQTKAMNMNTFFTMVVFLMSFQVISGLIISFIEQLFALPYFEDISTELTLSSILMFIYIAFVAPISEELIFRGVIVRELQKHGKMYAIICSAILFSLFHANLFQLPFTFLAGILLAYVAIEYSVFWAIVFHIINNLIIVNLNEFLSFFLHPAFAYLMTDIVLFTGLFISIIILVLKWRSLRSYILLNQTSMEVKSQVWRSSGFWGFVIFMIISIVAMFA